MHSIDIDFDVYKELTARRESEDVTYNDVLRIILKLPAKSQKSEPLETPALTKKAALEWITKGVKFPEGTQFRTTYKGKQYTGKVLLGRLWVEDKTYESLSGAAVAITGNPVNGWRFWECKPPAASTWMPAEVMRG
jgi:hypothetical protein